MGMIFPMIVVLIIFYRFYPKLNGGAIVKTGWLSMGAVALVVLLILFGRGVFTFLLTGVVVLVLCVYVYFDFKKLALAHGRKDYTTGIYGTGFFLCVYSVVAMFAEWNVSRGRQFESYLQTIVTELLFGSVAWLICKLVILVLNRRWTKGKKF